VEFVVTNVATIIIPLWGMIGIWTTRLGFHNVWEFWAYNVIFGLFQAPYYAFSQTMMAGELQYTYSHTRIYHTLNIVI
jgi:MFS-type transporter involved in bile tolerance (Atg22 family)